MTTHEAAMRVMGNLGGNHPPELSPILTAIIIRLIALVIEKCGEKIIDNFMNDPSWFNMMYLRILTRKAFKDRNKTTRQTRAEYAEHGDEVLKAFLKTAKESTREEVSNLVLSYLGNK